MQSHVNVSTWPCVYSCLAAKYGPTPTWWCRHDVQVHVGVGGDLFHSTFHGGYCCGGLLAARAILVHHAQSEGTYDTDRLASHM